jgi:hypothetical protein
MSRGLGRLQAAILCTLDKAKDSFYSYTGYREGLVRYHGREFDLPPDVYDLRASLQYLARATGEVETGLTLRVSTIALPAFSSAFSRAVRGLVSAGYLELWSSPVHRGPYREPWPNRRLVRRTKKAICQKTAAMYNAYLEAHAERAAKYNAYRITREARLAAWQRSVAMTAIRTPHGIVQVKEKKGLAR